MQTQTHFRVLTAVLLFSVVSCVHAPTSAPPDTDWTDESSNHAAYVQHMPRFPSATSKYKTSGDCGGFPKIDVKTAPGFCVGLVGDHASLRKPRTAAAVSANSAFLVDQGSWEPVDGKIFLITWANGTSSLKEIMNKNSFAANDARRAILDRPHQISKGPDGKYYVGSATALSRFDAADPVRTTELLIKDLPAQGLHPLKAFAFDDQGHVFINVGSATNVCQKFGKDGSHARSCPEGEDLKIGQAQIRRYQFQADRTLSKDYVVFAKGLRNSVALAWDEKRRVVLQGENGRDAIAKADARLKNTDFPHEELNVLEEGKHYGWPYCYDNNVPNPEWNYMNCSGYQKPYLLLPAHAAPLAFHFYQGDLFPAWYKGRLIATFHGYEATGHRIVAFKRDDNGLPTGVAQSIVYGWDKKGEQNYGSPVGLTELADGSMLIVEDTNRKVLRLFFDASAGNGTPVQEVDGGTVADPQDPAVIEKRRAKLEAKLKANPGPFTLFQHEVIDKTCFECHGGESAPGIQLLQYDDEGNAKRITEAGKAKEIFEMMKANPNFPTMPPQGFDNPAEQKRAAELIGKWVGTLK